MAAKLVTIDIDGTLINDDFGVSNKTIKTIQRLKEDNIITLSTGRPHRAAKYYADLLGIQAPLISFNGAYIKHSSTNEVIFHDTLSREVTLGILELCRKNPQVIFHLHYEDVCYIENKDEFALFVQSDLNFKAPVLVSDLSEIISKSEKAPTKVLITGEPDILDAFTEELKKIYGTMANIAKSGSRFLDITGIYSEKSRALQTLSKMMNVAREDIIAIGDNFNDLDMLEFAGIGVAMGNAPDEVKKRADFIAPSNNDDGVAYALEKLLS